MKRDPPRQASVPVIPGSERNIRPGPGTPVLLSQSQRVITASSPSKHTTRGPRFHPSLPPPDLSTPKHTENRNGPIQVFLRASCQEPMALKLKEIIMCRWPRVYNAIHASCTSAFAHMMVSIALHPIVAVFLGAILIYVTKVLLTRKKAPGPLPPGPPGKPIIGNITDLPPPGGQDWMHWLKHKQQYGGEIFKNYEFSF